MNKIALVLVLALAFAPDLSLAFSLPTARQHFEAEECPSTIRQATKAGKRAAAKFSMEHPSGTWNAFLSTQKVSMRKCSALIKKFYVGSARQSMTKKVTRSKRFVTPRRSLNR
jgi:hypothetical protein